MTIDEPMVRAMFPEQSDEWVQVYLLRLAWYVVHRGDMTHAPEFP